MKTFFNQTLFNKLLLALSLTLLGSSASWADSKRHYNPHGSWYNYQEPWATEYARIAIKQNKRNHRLHCGFRGARWSSDYYSHYRWASRVSRHKAEREIERRKRDLKYCKRHAGNGHYRDDDYGSYGGYGYGDRDYNGHRDRDYRYDRYADNDRYAFARYYAETAVSQAQKNIRLGCGFRGNRWTTNYRDHFRYGKKSSRHKAEKEISIRKRYLTDCRRQYRRY